MSVVGIDFGTQWCTMAVAQRGGIDIIPNDASHLQDPTLVGFTDKQRTFGEAAQTQMMRNMKNTISCVKRLIGRSFKDPIVQAELKESPYKIIEQENGSVGIEVMHQGEKVVFSPTEAAAMILGHLKRLAEHHLKSVVCDVVISVPAYWTDRQRRAMLDAARIAGLNPLRAMNDTTATALQYGIYRNKELPEKEEEAIKVLFVDVGYADTTATVVNFSHGKLKVSSAECDDSFGSRDLDNILYKHFAEEILQKYKIDINTNLKARLRILAACSKIKTVLSASPISPLNVDCVMNDIDVRGSLKKEEFQDMLAATDIQQRLLAPVDRALAAAQLKASDLHSVEISGAGLRSTQLQKILSDHLGVDLSRTTNAEESVARGCALQCAILSPVFKVREFAVTDITPAPVRLVWKGDDQSEDNVTDVFTEGNVVPSSKYVTLPYSAGYVVKAEYAKTNASESDPSDIATYNIRAAEPTEGAEPAKIKLKVRLNVHSLFNVESAEMVETYYVEEDAPATETPKTDAKDEKKTDDKEKKTDDKEEKKDEKKDDAMATDESPAAKKEGENKDEEKTEEAAEPPAKVQKLQKKKQRRRFLTVNATVPGALSEDKFTAARAEELARIASDEEAVATAEAKNAVETYIYDTRDKLNHELLAYSTDAEREKLLPELQTTEDWLYDEGDEQKRSVYEQKLAELRKLGDPIKQRKIEAELLRPEAQSRLEATANEYLVQAKTSLPEYEHIDAAEKEKVVKAAEAALEWMREQIDAQLKLAKSAPAAVFAKDFDAKRTELINVCKPIMTKPKPKPKPVEKKEEKKDDEKKEDEKKTESTEEEKKSDETDKPAESKTEEKKAEDEMEVDK